MKPCRLLTPIVALALAACSVSQDQETQIGHDQADTVRAQLPMLDDAQITGYVDSLGKAIAAKTSRADLKWQFAVVNTDVVNAFALPGGYVFVNRGLIAQARNESELAAVVSHEVEHVVRRHGVQQMEKAQGANVGIALACRLTNICNHASAQIAIQLGGAAAFARFSRKDEIEADSGGFRNEMRAGLDPRGMLTFFEQLMSNEQRTPSLLAWFADHPGTQDRVTDVKRWLAAESPSMLNGLRQDGPAFQAMKQHLSELPPAPKPPADTSRR